MDRTRDLHDHELEQAADASLGSPKVVGATLCVFCAREGDYGIRGKRVCQGCAGEIFRAYRRNKQFREQLEHGIRAADPATLFRPMILPSTPSLPSRHCRSDWGDPA